MAKQSVNRTLQRIPLDQVKNYLEKQKKTAKKQAQKLLKQKRSLLASLEKLDAKLAALGVKPGVKAKPKLKPRKRVVAKTPERRRTRRGDLEKAIMKVLVLAKGPLRPVDIVKRILKRGLYKNVKSLYAQVMQNMKKMNQVKKVGKGTYALNGISKKRVAKKKTPK